MASQLPDTLSEYVTDGMEPFYLQPRQMEFAESTADIVVFGGSVGGGKTRALIYEPIARGLHENPGFTDVIFRETFPEIMELGGPWNEACEVYPWLGARMVIGAHEARFPSGACCGFRYLDNEETKFKYKGSQFCRIAFDELTHFSESRVRYMFSRNRSTCGIKPYMRATTNPDPGWVKVRLLAPWVDRNYPGRPAQSCELRWLRYNEHDEPEWFEQPVERARSITFIRSKLADNPALLAANPDYEATLQFLTPVERERLLNGNWDVRREGLVYPDFESCIVTSAPDHVLCNGGMDFGINNPFAAPAGFLDHDDVLWITWMRYKNGVEIAVHSAHLPLGVRWWCDPSGSEQRLALRNAGHDVVPCVHIPLRGASGERKNPKLGGIDMVTHRMRTGRLRILRNEMTMPLLRELSNYHYDETKQVEEPVDEDNHACDALRYFVVGIDRGRSVPSVRPVESDADRKLRHEQEAATKLAHKQELDRLAQDDPDNPRWEWNQA
jgi:hypothetical protein